MKKENIDQLIEQALTEDEAVFYHELDEQGVFSMWRGIYKGKLGKWAMLISVIQVITTGFAFYFGYLFFTVDETTLMIRYGAIMFITLLMTGQLKHWLWMQMDKNAIIRELKKAELQISLLASKINK